MKFKESIVEKAALDWLTRLECGVLLGPDLAAGMIGAERTDPNFRDVVAGARLRQALLRLNPELPAETLGDAERNVMRVEAATLIERNRAVHRMLVDRATVEYRRKEGSIAGRGRGGSISRTLTTTTGSRSISSRWSRGSTSGGRTS